MSKALNEAMWISMRKRRAQKLPRFLGRRVGDGLGNGKEASMAEVE